MGKTARAGFEANGYPVPESLTQSQTYRLGAITLGWSMLAGVLASIAAGKV